MWTRGAALVCAARESAVQARIFVLRATLHCRQLSGGGTLCRSAPVDLRSDTVTKPSAAMRAAMASAQVGDDVYGEDPTVQELEARVAVLLGKEAAVLLPSGTMANLACILAHTRRGDQVLLSRHSHIYSWEQGNVSSLAGCITTPLDTRVDGTFALEELREVPNSLSVPCSDSIANRDPTQPRLTSAPYSRRSAMTTRTYRMHAWCVWRIRTPAMRAPRYPRRIPPRLANSAPSASCSCTSTARVC